MLSYRHAFHAGNHADVLKHLIQVQIIDYLGQKAKPFWYIDTHAGAGAYSLTEGYATKTAEYVEGVARLWQRDDAPAAVKRYLEVVAAINTDADGALRYYPGSPWFAAETMAGSEKLRLFELHPSDHQLLQDCFADAGRRVRIERANGFEAIKSLLPPPPHPRGLCVSGACSNVCVRAPDAAGGPRPRRCPFPHSPTTRNRASSAR